MLWKFLISRDIGLIPNISKTTYTFIFKPFKISFNFIRAQLFVHYSFASTYGAISMYNCLPIT